MTEAIADRLHREPGIQQALRAGMPERVRPARPDVDAQAAHARADNLPHRRPAERLRRLAEG